MARKALIERNNGFGNNKVSDKAERNINFLNERARPPQRDGRTGAAPFSNYNGSPETMST